MSWQYLCIAALISSASASTNDDAAIAAWVYDSVKNVVTTEKPASSAGGLNLDEGNRHGDTTPFNLNPTSIDGSVNCMTIDHQPGICVVYYQCDIMSKTVIEDGASILDVRVKSCPHYLDVCCKENNVASDPAPTFLDTATQSQSQPTVGPGGGDANLDAAPPRNNDQNITPSGQRPIAPVWAAVANQKSSGKKDAASECGWTNPGASPLTVRDSGTKITYAEYGEFPWMVALLKRSSDDSTTWSQSDYLGGGTLIHPSVVMTVAHKLTIKKTPLKDSELKCRAGEWDTQTEAEIYRHQERNVAKHIIHENYYRTSLYNDIALLIMESPFSLKNAPHIGTGCLVSTPPTGTTCYSMGWGKEYEDQKQTALILKKVPLQLVEHNTCQRMLRENSRLGPFFEVHDSLTCAVGKKDIDTCRGDGGSPLVCPISNDPGESRYAVYGMVAYGLKCGDPKIPSLYANVPLLKDWVDRKMDEEGFTQKHYYTV